MAAITWTVETVGTGLIANDDLADAPEQGYLYAALRKAVEQAAALLIPLHTLDKKEVSGDKKTGYM